MALFKAVKADHPMADIKQAKLLISELPANDSLKALEEVTFWLDSVTRTEGFKLDYHYSLFEMLDQAARVHQRRLAQEYITTDRQEKFHEKQLWSKSFEFWKMLGTAYNHCIEQYQAGVSGAGAIKKDLPAIIARTVRTLNNQLKWYLLHYGPVEDRVWGELGRLYLFAEAKGIATTSVTIYPGDQGTVQHEFLKAMMLGASSTDGLAPLRQEIAERTIAHFSSQFALQSEPGPGCRYGIDLSMRKAPARIMRNFEAGPMTRCFGAGKGAPALESLIAEIKAKEAVPSHINLGGIYDRDLVVSVFQHLALYWSDTAPARSSERRPIATRLTVLNGLRNILKNVMPEGEDAALDMMPKDEGESWIVENVSDGGFGAIIPQVKGDWIKVGSLLGVQTETAQFWGAGVIRRITRDEYQQRRVGIQLLSITVIPVKLWPSATGSSFNATQEGEPAILLSTTPDKNGEITIMMREGSFEPHQALDMNVRGRQYYLMPGRLVEDAEEFDLVNFKVMQRT